MKPYRIVAVLILIAMTITNVPYISIASDITPIPYMALLEDLDIMPDKSENKIFSRGEFAIALAKIAGFDPSGTGDVPYTDVTRDSDCFNAVRCLYELGVFTPSDDFFPQRLITPTEAIKSAVALLGYDEIAKHMGGWPSGYIKCADDIGLSDNISGDIDYNNVCILLYNALNTRLPGMNIINGEANYTLMYGDTYLKSVFHLDCVSGEFSGAQYFGGEFGLGVGDNKTQIGDMILHSGKYDTDSYYGQYADVYYDENYNIVSVCVIDKRSENTVVINSNADAEYDNLVYTVTDSNNKTRKYTIADNATIIKNGKKSVYEKRYMLPEYGNVKLIKKSGNVYDTVIIESYEQIVVGAKDSQNYYVTDVNDSSVSFVLDPEVKKVSIADQNGRKIGFDSIEKYNVLWVAESDDGELVKAVLSKDAVSGIITGISDGHIHIDGGEYNAEIYVENQVSQGSLLGMLVDCRLNFNRDIVYCMAIADSNDGKVGYLIQSKDTSSGLENECSVKLLTSDGRIQVLNLAENLSVNGKIFKSKQYDSLPKDAQITDSMPIGLVQYSLNSKGELSVINYTKEIASTFGVSFSPFTKGGHISMYTTGTNVDTYIQYKPYDRVIMGQNPGRIFLKPDTIQFKVPLIADFFDAQDRDYTVKPMSEYSAGEYMSNYNHTGYSLSTELAKCDYIVSEYNLSSASSDNIAVNGVMGIVTSVSDSFNEDGMTSKKIVIKNRDTDVVSYMDISDSSYGFNVKEGDIVQIAANKNKEIDAISILYRAGENTLSNVSNKDGTGYTLLNSDTMLTNNRGIGTLSSSLLILGRVYNKYDDIISVLPMNTDCGNYTEDIDLYGYSLKSAVVYTYNIKKQTLTKADNSYFKDYVSFGDRCSNVVVFSKSGNTSAVYIYE